MSTQHILVVDDENDIRSLISEILTEEGYEVSVAADATQARAKKAQVSPDLILLDIWMPDTDGISLLREWSEEDLSLCPVVMMSGHGTVDTAVEATRLGAMDFIEKPLSLAKLLRTVERALQSSSKKAKQHGQRVLPSLIEPVGRSSIIRTLREHAQHVASKSANVLIVGEMGTGREVFARYVHDQQHGDAQPFIHISAGMMGEADAARRLFGRGDGENAEPGLFGEAGQGTVFISELADLDAQTQKLLAATLEQGVYQRTGGTNSIRLRARVIASVQPDYEQTIKAGDLRRDLISAIDVLRLQVPPLRDYAQDVPELLRFYVDFLVEADALEFRRFGIAAQNRLRNYPWPGNLRDLRNLVQRCLLAGGEEEVSLEEIEQELSKAAPASEPLVKQDLLSLPLREAREQFERAYLTSQLQLCDGKVGQLSKRVGMERTHLYRKLRSLGVDFRQASTSDD